MCSSVGSRMCLRITVSTLSSRQIKVPLGVDLGRSRQTRQQLNGSTQAGACDDALPMAGCVKLFCRKISAPIALKCVCVELYYFGGSARVSLGFRFDRASCVELYCSFTNQRTLFYKPPLLAGELARILAGNGLFLKPCGGMHAELELLGRLRHEIDYQAVSDAAMSAGDDQRARWKAAELQVVCQLRQKGLLRDRNG